MPSTTTTTTASTSTPTGRVLFISPSRPSKRRRLTPSQSCAAPAPTATPAWRTSQCVLTRAEADTVLRRAGVPGALARVLRAEQLQLPKGLQPLEWLLPMLGARLPPTFAHELLTTVAAAAAVPAAVPATTPQLVPLAALALAIPVTKNVLAVRLRRAATPAATAAAITDLLPPAARHLSLQYRGCARGARGFFAPVLPPAATTEFGAGLYTTPHLDYAVHLAGAAATGVVYIFADPPRDGLAVATVHGREWNRLVVGGKTARVLGRADVLAGRVSRDCWAAKEACRSAVEDSLIEQVVWRSGEACRRLAEGVGMVVFLED